MLALAWSHRQAAWFEYRLWQDFERAGANEQGFREYRHREMGMVFVRLPGGTFRMGWAEHDREVLVSVPAGHSGAGDEWVPPVTVDGQFSDRLGGQGASAAGVEQR